MANPTTPADWTTESSYWRTTYTTRPYYSSSQSYDFYEPAYRVHTIQSAIHRDRSWEDVKADLERGWESYKLSVNWRGTKSRTRCVTRGIAQEPARPHGRHHIRGNDSSFP